MIHGMINGKRKRNMNDDGDYYRISKKIKLDNNKPEQELKEAFEKMEIDSNYEEKSNASTVYMEEDEKFSSEELSSSSEISYDSDSEEQQVKAINNSGKPKGNFRSFIESNNNQIDYRSRRGSDSDSDGKSFKVSSSR